jgi:hypothetical protein
MLLDVMMNIKFDLEKEKIRLSKDNYNRKTNLPKRLQQVYDTLMDNGIEVSDCYWEGYDDGGGGKDGQWWFELGSTINYYEWDEETSGHGSITGSNTEVVNEIKNCSIIIRQDQTRTNYNPYTIVKNDK